MLRIDPSLVALFGSARRVAILGLLANATAPKTGYAIAKATGVAPVKVYAELRKLEEAGFLERSQDLKGSSRYRLADAALVAFLRPRVRIVAWEDWFSPESIREREKAVADAERVSVKFPSRTVSPRVPSTLLLELVRRPGKDALLARVQGLARARRPRGR